MYKADESNYNLDEEDNKKKEEKKKKSSILDSLDSKTKMVVVMCGALFLGLLVFLFTNMLFSGSEPKKSDVEEDIQLDIKDKDIEKVYNYVKFGEDNIFVKMPNVTTKNLSNYDKFYYASQFITRKDVQEVKSASTKATIYKIDYSVMKKYINRMFGSSNKFEKNVIIPVVFNFTIDDKNVAMLSYDKTLSSYIVNLTGKKDTTSSKKIYSKLIDGRQISDDEIELEEKVLYYDLKEDNGKVDCTIYKDYEHTMLVSKDEGIESTKFNMDDLYKSYKKKATSIVYRFKKDSEGSSKDKNNYYFVSSKIKIK